MIDSPRPTRIVIPGIDDSGPDHWQSRLSSANPAYVRIAPSSWSSPVLSDWLAALDRAVAAAAPAPLLVAHSLGTLLVAHWAAGRSGPPVRGALLVALPDPAAPSFPAAAGSFREVPRRPLPFPSIVVASATDPYDPHHAAAGYAEAWGSRFVDVGPCGHVNVESGHGPWPLASELLDALDRRG